MSSDADLKFSHFAENCGLGLITAYNNSPMEVLDSLGENPITAPEPPTSRQKHYWNSPENQRKFADALARKLGFDPLQNPIGWYNVTRDDFIASSGGGLLQQFQSSPYLFLKAVYPEHSFLPWKFRRLSQHASRDPEALKVAIKFIEDSLGLRDMEDWYRVSAPQLEELGVNQFLLRAGGLVQVLQQVVSSSELDDRLVEISCF